MFEVDHGPIGCPKYRRKLEETLLSGASPEAGSDLEAHLQECAPCRQAVATAALASQLVRDAQRPLQYSDAFVTRVMATIREQESIQAGPGAFWRLLELLASRFALVAALVLLGVSLYLAEFTPTRNTLPATGTTEIGAGLPEPPVPPANDDEILMSLVERNDGI
jgi:predicted anti-sigma-YlaC factor YlaD